MKKNLYIIGIALLTAWTLPAFSQVSNDNEDRVNKIDVRWAKNDFVPGQVLVKFKDANRVQVRRSQGQFSSTSIDKVTTVLRKYGTDEMEQLLPNENPNRKMRRARAFNGEMIQERDLSQLYCLKLSAEHQHETMQMIEALSALDEVEYAEPNYRCYIMASYIGGTGVRNNPYLDDQWYLSSYGLGELWDQPIINSERPVIAIIDTGVDTEHPDLKDNCIEGYDFINNTSRVTDDNMHGTHVAGIAAACNNDIGILGANPLALIMPIKVLNENGVGNTATILQGVSYAVEHGAKILNLSLGHYGYSKAEADVFRNASLSAIIVAAAGNDGKCIYSSHTGLLKHGIQPEPSFPGAYSFVLGVQATNKDGSLTSFSNYDDDGPLFSCEASTEEPDGFNYELKAPGKGILSTIPGGGYTELDGTSMASPLVAGAISALLMLKNYDSRERLLAELLHTNNIAEAFYLKDLPIDLDIVKVLVGERADFTEEGKDDFSSIKEVHAGETISLYPEVRCTFGEASNIKLTLSLAENEDPNIIQIVNGEADFGWHLDTFGRAVSKNPLVVKFLEDIPDKRHVRLNIAASYDEQEGSESQILTFLVNNIDGIHGTISEDMTLTADRSYYVDDNVTIDANATLTIEPGTRIEFAGGVGLKAVGKLVAKGTPEKPIIFTSRDIGNLWGGISSTESYSTQNYLYMNSDTTLFSVWQTELTPIKVDYGLRKTVYHGRLEDRPSKDFDMENYFDNWDADEDLSKKKELLDDPYCLTPNILKGLKEWRNYCAQYPTTYSQEKPQSEVVMFYFAGWKIYEHPIDTITYCRMEEVSFGNDTPYMKDCVIENSNLYVPTLQGERIVITGCADVHFRQYVGTAPYINYKGKKQKYWNYANNNAQYYLATSYQWSSWAYIPKISDLMESNYVNNTLWFKDVGKEYHFEIRSSEPEVDHSDYPSYLGTSCEEFVRPYVYELGNSYSITWGTIDLSNMRKTPVSEAHGIVWKVLVNGKDAQDEYEDLAPLGVGKHKFEVYFNRPMNKAVDPKISFGVCDPWTQNSVDEDGSWNEEGTIYTAYKTITGKTSSDGVNRIYVRGAEDNEFFPCPYEKSRFNINVQAAGSMATGFAAEASVGRVNLTWDNSQNDIEDAMGYNVYRFNDEKKKTIPGHYENGKWVEPVEVPDTVRINEKILDVETSVYTDYDVIPNHTYYYLYKVLSTDLKEYDVSNIVAATPKTSILGDANGSGDVDVADVVTTVNFAIGMTPDPFIFDAADMNADKNIDVLDVIGIVQKVLYPNGVSAVLAVADLQATYTIEDGILYVESPVAIAGVQVQVTLDGKGQKEEIRTADDLKGFEQASAWLTDEDYLLLAYSMNGKTLEPGKHALLYVGDSDITQLRLSDSHGRQIKAIAGQGSTNLDTMGSRIKRQEGIYDLQGRKLSTFNSQLSTLKKGVYIINGQKVVK